MMGDYRNVNVKHVFCLNYPRARSADLCATRNLLSELQCVPVFQNEFPFDTKALMIITARTDG